MKYRGAQVLIECLQEEQVETIFGYPGGAVIDIYDTLYDADIQHILTRHEQGAIHAADGYARASGRPGVVLATSGPGATNLITGLATAYSDSVPLVVFTGQVPRALLGRDAFQEADMVGITIPVTKHNYMVTELKELPSVIKEAFHIASSGRPGPVLIDLPKNIWQEEIEFSYPKAVHLPGYKPTLMGHHKQIKLAAKAIIEAKQPVIFAGGGVTHGQGEEELRGLAEKQQIPVCTSLMGVSAFPLRHPLALGMLGMHGTSYANTAVTECDLLITVGARFSDRVTGKIERFAPKAQIIHIDIDPAEIGKNIRVDIPIVGDVKNILAMLLSELDLPKYRLITDKSPWQEKITGWKKLFPLQYEKEGTLKPQHVIEEISRITGGEAIVTTEVGQHQMWAAQYYGCKHPRSFLTSGGLGTMGFGFPAAIGAQLAQPERTVFCIAGDGSFQMNIQELGTIMTYDLPIKIALLNNNALGMVRQWQEIIYQERYSHTIWEKAPDFIKIADAYHIKGIRVEEPGAVSGAIEEAIAHPGPVFMEFVVAQEENVFPMVLPGKPIEEMLLSEVKTI